MLEKEAPQTCNAPDDPTTSARLRLRLRLRLSAESHGRKVGSNRVGLQKGGVEMLTRRCLESGTTEDTSRRLEESCRGHWGPCSNGQETLTSKREAPLGPRQAHISVGLCVESSWECEPEEGSVLMRMRCGPKGISYLGNMYEPASVGDCSGIDASS